MKVKDGIIGLVVGDALGVPVEFTSRHELEKDPVVDMREHGTYDMPKGTWSDDSSMAIATMASIVNKQCIDYDDIMNEFVEWHENDKYSQYYTFDSGNTTVRGLSRFKNGTPALKSGGNEIHDNGNGSLMRILPIALYSYYKKLNNISTNKIHKKENKNSDIVHSVNIHKMLNYENKKSEIKNKITKMQNI